MHVLWISKEPFLNELVIKTKRQCEFVLQSLSSTLGVFWTTNRCENHFSSNRVWFRKLKEMQTSLWVSQSASSSVYHVFPIDWMCSFAFILSEAILVFRGSASSSVNLSIKPEHWYAGGGGHTAPIWGRGWLSVDELKNCGGV